MPCLNCVRRNWLLGKLSVRLEYRGRDPERLGELLALDDADLITAIGGRRRDELRRLYERFEPTASRTPGVEAICRHDQWFPGLLEGDAQAPSLLNVAGGRARLEQMLEAPVVAIVGTQRPTDYGIETARELARGLAASGLTVAGELREGIASAVQEGALEARGSTLAVSAGGLDTFRPASTRALSLRVRRHGCAISAARCGLASRGWCHTVAARLVAGFARLVIVVETLEGERDLAAARAAQQAGKALGAVPGRVTSPVSRGSHLLLREGAELIREPQDVLDLLYGVGAQHAIEQGKPLEPRLGQLLDRIGAGEDTLAKLIPDATAPESAGSKVLLALAELELMGLLGRGDGGRYVARVGRAGPSG